MKELKPRKKKEIKLNDFDADQLSRYVIAARQIEVSANNYVLLLGIKEHGFNLKGNVHRVDYNIQTKTAVIEEYDEKEFNKKRKQEALLRQSKEPKGPRVTNK